MSARGDWSTKVIHRELSGFQFATIDPPNRGLAVTRSKNNGLRLTAASSRSRCFSDSRFADWLPGVLRDGRVSRGEQHHLAETKKTNRELQRNASRKFLASMTCNRHAAQQETLLLVSCIRNVSVNETSSLSHHWQPSSRIVTHNNLQKEFDRFS